MKRRDVLTLLGGAAVARPLVARAQQPVIPVIAFLGTGLAQSSTIVVDAFKSGMRDQGLVENRDYSFLVRWAEEDYERLPAIVHDLAAENAKVIVVGTAAAAQAVRRFAPSIPIVMNGVNDPVGAGLITSLARPGGNITGLSNMVEDFTPKMVEMMRATLPRLSAMAALFNPAKSFESIDVRRNP